MAGLCPVAPEVVEVNRERGFFSKEWLPVERGTQRKLAGDTSLPLIRQSATQHQSQDRWVSYKNQLAQYRIAFRFESCA